MWGPDLTIRALYITRALKGAMEQREGERAGEVRTHTCTNVHMYRDKFKCTLAKAAMHSDGHCKYEHAECVLWSERSENDMLRCAGHAQHKADNIWLWFG